MDELLFGVGLGIGLLGVVTWGWKTLPDECWQFLASISVGKAAGGAWRGRNLTYSGALIAMALSAPERRRKSPMPVVAMASRWCPYKH